ncbi:MAG: M20/M25/M40 family metallo-hydrolase [Phycisphaerales bacterium]|nr:M20/M25/M40 family metallo-hydrolase [Phycisphaerales bacterium]
MLHCLVAGALLSAGWMSPDRPAPAAEVDAARLMATVDAFPHKRSPEGSPEHLQGLRDTEAMIREELTGLGYDVHEQPVPWVRRPRAEGAEPIEWFNLWVDIRGSERTGEVVLVGAHFDAVPRSPGADDNASGAAAALELARVLRGREPRRTIRIMFFTLEEYGLVGSRAYVEEFAGPNHREGKETIAGMISLDMIGIFSDAENSQRSPLPRVGPLKMIPTTANFITVVGIQSSHELSAPFAESMAQAAPDLPVLRFDMLAVPIPDMLRSDHAPFWGMGVPAIHITDTSEFRYDHYHRPTDTIDRIDRDRYAMVVRGIAQGVWDFANAPPAAPPAAPGGDARESAEPSAP